ncbi:MAG: outer membrane beta-barrel protein [Cryomorphaceae bacterium]
MLRLLFSLVLISSICVHANAQTDSSFVDPELKEFGLDSIRVNNDTLKGMDDSLLFETVKPALGMDSSLDTMNSAMDTSTVSDSIAIQPNAFEQVLPDTQVVDSLANIVILPGKPDSIRIRDSIRWSKLYYGGYFSPELNFVMIGKYPSNVSEYSSGTKGRFSVALVLGYQILEKLQVELGVGYGIKSFRFKRTGKLEDVSGDSVFGLQASTQLQYDVVWQELQFPLMMKWEVWENRISINAGYEVQYQFNMTSVERLLDDKELMSEKETLVPNRLNAAPILSAEYRYALNETVLMHVEPIVKPYVRYFDLGTRRGQLLSVGLKLGVTF